MHFDWSPPGQYLPRAIGAIEPRRRLREFGAQLRIVRRRHRQAKFQQQKLALEIGRQIQIFKSLRLLDQFGGPRDHPLAFFGRNKNRCRQ